MKKGDNILCIKDFDVFKKYDIFTVKYIFRNPGDLLSITIIKNDSKQKFIISNYNFSLKFKVIPLKELRQRKLIHLLYVVEEE